MILEYKKEERKMKKIICMLCLVLVGSLAGCSSNDKETKKEPKVETKKKDKEDKKDKEEKKEKEEVNSSALSSNWKDNQIQIKGKVYTFPLELKELKAIGFDFENLGEYVVNPQQGLYGKGMVDAEGNRLSGVYTNLTESAVDIRETSLTEVTILKDYRMESNKNFDVVLPGGLKFGDTVDQSKALFGEPSKVYETGSTVVLNYYDDGSSLKHMVELTFWDGKLISYNLKANPK